MNLLRLKTYLISSSNSKEFRSLFLSKNVYFENVIIIIFLIRPMELLSIFSRI